MILSGLPGVGKTTIARELAAALTAVHVRIDSIEQALRDAGLTVEEEGYRVAYAVAEDNLRLGRIVIADCVNPWPLTRRAWHAAQSAWNSFARTSVNTNGGSSHDYPTSLITGYQDGRR